MIEFKNVSKIYHSKKERVVALSDISFEIKKTEFVSIIGKSGAGKTSLIKLLINEEKPTQGEIFFEQECVQKMNQKTLQNLRQRVGVVHQDYKLLLAKNVRENVEYVMQVIGASEKEISRDIPQILEMVNLGHRQENFPLELSGGEKQRLAIAKALCHQPEVIIADEPTGNLDVYNTFEIIDILKKIHQLGTTVILSTHNKGIVDNLKQRVIVLDQGKIIRDSEQAKFIL
ncbi:cell division ATP-binding protein FtsE [bacterium (Candidatus Gribaldobacteria) CG_4_10_14_0_8_um_filter_33_9]|uniref:Cell division ATP-binding protein FtsE n=1 Tax=bacterium (Candidatus Gribaldobacteria) CG_4_10_14_0_8_um_filter_33_9 TaxID=2014266 RepID=A0A2M7RPC1_9BACT|nr:MAG: cell division ATP-binding protein FtsE [bacterium (Candidatus Gribaldobacteria) CG_4_10_14_0_8_um_filter_33_9]